MDTTKSTGSAGRAEAFSRSQTTLADGSAGSSAGRAEAFSRSQTTLADGSAGSSAGRLRFFDALRGLSVVSMVGFHLCYDLYFLKGVPLAFFEVPFRDIWRNSISWTFLFVAGTMVVFSRDNFRRSIRYGALAFAIWVVTTLAAVDAAINFGIIFCMAASTFVAWLLERLGAFAKADLPCAAALLVCFLLTLHVSSAWIGLGPVHIELPAALYSTPWFSWLGFPGPGFISGDYYPVIPYSLLYLASTYFSSYVMTHGGFPAWCYTCGSRALELVGRHPLLVYVAHQPIIVALLFLLPF